MKLRPVNKESYIRGSNDATGQNRTGGRGQKKAGQGRREEDKIMGSHLSCRSICKWRTPGPLQRVAS